MTEKTTLYILWTNDSFITAEKNVIAFFSLACEWASRFNAVSDGGVLYSAISSPRHDGCA